MRGLDLSLVLDSRVTLVVRFVNFGKRLRNGWEEADSARKQL